MSQFARSADWLRKLFIPSRTGWQTPGRVADEVSLVQPYDGGGFPLAPPGQWIISTVHTTGANGTETIVAISAEEIARILAVSAIWEAGVQPTVNIRARITGTAPSLSISESRQLATINEMEGILLHSPICPPSHDLQLRWFGGDAATEITSRILLARAPLGSVFYV